LLKRYENAKKSLAQHFSELQQQVA
jgi:hypothetical protein